MFHRCFFSVFIGSTGISSFSFGHILFFQRIIFQIAEAYYCRWCTTIFVDEWYYALCRTDGCHQQMVHNKYRKIIPIAILDAVFFPITFRVAGATKHTRSVSLKVTAPNDSIGTMGIQNSHHSSPVKRANEEDLKFIMTF